MSKSWRDQYFLFSDVARARDLVATETNDVECINLASPTEELTEEQREEIEMIGPRNRPVLFYL